MGDTLRIAMWSGPRNISTALMRSFGSRADTIVCDEPFYARYLLRTGADHPGREEVIAACETDYDRIVATLTGPLPAGKSIFYQKHMAHHILAEDWKRLDWVHAMRNVLLIRNPLEVLASFVKVVPNPRAGHLGLPQQLRLFHVFAERLGHAPPVIDATDVLDDPPRMLWYLCEAVGIDFDDAMLSWAPGPRETDGVWGPHWYHAVYQSTGFERPRARNADVPMALQPVLAECRGIYDCLHEFRIRL